MFAKAWDEIWKVQITLNHWGRDHLLAGGFDGRQCPWTQNGRHTSSVLYTWHVEPVRADIRVVLYVVSEGIIVGAKCVWLCVKSSMALAMRLKGCSHIFAFVCVCACLYVRVSLLMCTLHSVAVVTTFFIRAIVVGLPPGAASHSLTSVKICQFDFFRVCCDLGILRTSRQQTLKLLREIRSLETLGATFIQVYLCLRVFWVTHVQFFSIDPVVFRELDIKLDVKVSLLEWVSILGHSLPLHHSNTTCHARTWNTTNTTTGTNSP